MKPSPLSPEDWLVYERLASGTAEHPHPVRAELGADVVRTALERLGAWGLVEYDPVCALPRVVEPVMGLDGVMRAWEAALDDVRQTATEIAGRWRRGQEVRGDLVEMLERGDAGLAAFEALQRAARDEVLIFDRPPYVSPNRLNTVQLEMMRDRRVQYRTVYAHAALATEEGEKSVRAALGAGEQARTTDRLPMKLVLVDRRVAMIPLEREEQSLHTAVLVRPCALLEALIELFESVWARALPLTLTGTLTARPAVSAQDEQLVRLLVSGLTDAAIARALGCAARTVQRRIARLMEASGSINRLQLGIHLAAAGWGPGRRSRD
ncbi:hypothetical protein [Streptomyces sp. NPDC057694]|uniref:hypothetical protein n=1 Tax=Streptomyces sp. NPDC057694 TaxID=3346216 RepID=UPI00368EA323